MSRGGWRSARQAKAPEWGGNMSGKGRDTDSKGKHSTPTHQPRAGTLGTVHAPAWGPKKGKAQRPHAPCHPLTTHPPPALDVAHTTEKEVPRRCRAAATTPALTPTRGVAPAAPPPTRTRTPIQPRSPTRPRPSARRQTLFQSPPPPPPAPSATGAPAPAPHPSLPPPEPGQPSAPAPPARPQNPPPPPPGAASGPGPHWQSMGG